MFHPVWACRTIGPSCVRSVKYIKPKVACHTCCGFDTEIGNPAAHYQPVDACIAYLQGIEYDLDESKRKGLRLFIEYLIEMGDANPDSLPLKICG